MTKRKPIFEHIECSRCGGTGRYSFNLMHGSMCYGCNGIGYKLTSRGRVAQHYLNQMREITMENFQIGDLIRFDGFNAGSYSQPTAWAKVTLIEFITSKQAGLMYQENVDLQCVRLETTLGTVVGFVGKTKYRKGFTAEQKKEQVNEALAYQQTLTKAGKPRKQKLAA